MSPGSRARVASARLHRGIKFGGYVVAVLVGLVGGLGILTLAGLVLVLGPAALPASARSLVPGWETPAGPKATTNRS
jgi:hypothetical protein